MATPSQYVMADERWQQLLQSQPPGHRRVLELLRAGHSHVDIAQIEGMDRRVIERLLRMLQRYLESS